MTIAELARAASVRQTTILRIETNGNDPRTRMTWVPLVAALRAATLATATA